MNDPDLIAPKQAHTGNRTGIVVSRKLLLEEYRVAVSIGVYPHEREAPQDILIDIELDLADLTVGGRDELSEVIDYDFLRDGISAVVSDRHFNLLETLCHEILLMIGGQPGVARARIRARKPNLYPDCRSMGYELTCMFSGD